MFLFFGALGPSAIRYLWVLAMLELRLNETLRNAQGLDPLSERNSEPIAIDPALLGWLLLW